MSQLYQLRGRVGRSNRLAYAYFTYRKDKILSEVAYKRLSSITEYSELGSGFKIAMKDLEIRGAGNILGREQHGHMMKVGYDMYAKLLKETVSELKGEKERAKRFYRHIYRYRSVFARFLYTDSSRQNKFLPTAGVGKNRRRNGRR